jgi:4-amino-4-deoxy-L-arabinose transferase-like glycosyltransferase
MTGGRPRWEWPLVLGLLLAAFAMRVWQLNDVPPGLHHDEVIIGQAAKDILRGHPAIYFTGGYGQEPLYHYVLAGFFAFLGANAFVLRLTSAFVAMLGLAVTYRLTRRLFSPVVAVGALAWMSISLWPIFFARVGLRGILLPVLTMLAAYFLWKALHSSRLQPYVLAGGLLGLSIYTYQASRVFPVIFAMFFIYLVLTHHSSVRSLPVGLVTRHSLLIWRAGVFFATALLVAAPLILYLTVINPSAEERVADLSGPLTQLRNGEPGEVIHSTLNTLGMFTIAGDAVPIYNVSGRPVFPEPIGAALFYIGLALCFWRWKQPAYAFMLIWFFISLMPAMVTPFSPNFVRTMAAWPAPFVFAGVGMQWVGAQADRLRGRLTKWSPGKSVVIAVFAGALAFNAGLTYRDYFLDWPRGDYVRFWQQAAWTQAARAINGDPSSVPVAASGLSIQDFDPQTFDLLGVRSAVKVKWFDCRTAVLYPGGASQWTVRYLVPPFFSCNASLASKYLPDMTVLTQPRWPDSGEPIFTLYQFSRPWSLNKLLLPLTVSPVIFAGPEQFSMTAPQQDLVQVHLPLAFTGLRFWGIAPYPATQTAGKEVEIDSFWELRQPISPPLKIFIHVTAPDGTIVAQWDGLDVNISTLETGDVFIQRHRLDLPADLLPGPYRVSLGAYHPDGGQRLTAQLSDRTIDSVVLTMLDVK